MPSGMWDPKPAYAKSGKPMSTLGFFLLFSVPLYITYAYQLMPVPIRKIWGMHGNGSSHMVIGAAMLGETNLWPTFLRCCSGVRYLPGYIAGAALRPFIGGRGNPWKASPWVMVSYRRKSVSFVRGMAAAFGVGFRAGLGIEKGDALWHGKSGEKADWIPTTGIGTVIPPTPPVGW